MWGNNYGAFMKGMWLGNAVSQSYKNAIGVKNAGNNSGMTAVEKYSAYAKVEEKVKVSVSFKAEVAVGQTRKLTEKEEMLEFQKEFWDEVASIPKSGTIDNLAIHVTDAAWERMKEEPQYRKQMMDLIRRDTTGNFIGQVNCIITIDGVSSKYRAQSWGSEGGAFGAKNKDDYVERRRKKRKEQEEILKAMRMRHKFLYEQGMQRGNVWESQKIWNEQNNLTTQTTQGETSSTGAFESSTSIMSVIASYEMNIPFVGGAV